MALEIGVSSIPVSEVSFPIFGIEGALTPAKVLLQGTLQHRGSIRPFRLLQRRRHLACRRRAFEKSEQVFEEEGQGELEPFASFPLS